MLYTVEMKYTLPYGKVRLNMREMSCLNTSDLTLDLPKMSIDNDISLNQLRLLVSTLSTKWPTIVCSSVSQCGVEENELSTQTEVV